MNWIKCSEELPNLNVGQRKEYLVLINGKKHLAHCHYLSCAPQQMGKITDLSLNKKIWEIPIEWSQPTHWLEIPELK